MPSTKVDYSLDSQDPFKQLMQLIEKKKRNMEKKRNKLEEYRKKAKDGQELDCDQKRSIEKYEGIIQSIEFVKEIVDQAGQMALDNERNLKKAVKKERLERDLHSTELLANLLRYQDVLTDMGDVNIRQWFLKGTHGMVQLTEQELIWMDALYILISPTRDVYPQVDEFEAAVKTSSEHIYLLLEGNGKSVLETTYKNLRDILQRVRACEYYSKGTRAPPAPVLASTNGVDHSESEVEEEDQQIEKKSTEEVMEPQKEEVVVSPSPSPQTRLPPMESYPPRSISSHTQCSSDQEPLPLAPSSIIEVLMPLQTSFNFLQMSEVDSLSPSHQKPPSLDAPSASSVPPPPHFDWGASSPVNSPPPAHNHSQPPPLTEPESSWASANWADQPPESTPGGDVFSSASHSAYLNSEEGPTGRGSWPRGGRGGGSRRGSRGGDFKRAGRQWSEEESGDGRREFSSRGGDFKEKRGGFRGGNRGSFRGQEGGNREDFKEGGGRGAFREGGGGRGGNFRDGGGRRGQFREGGNRGAFRDDYQEGVRAGFQDGDRQRFQEGGRSANHEGGRRGNHEGGKGGFHEGGGRGVMRGGSRSNRGDRFDDNRTGSQNESDGRGRPRRDFPKNNRETNSGGNRGSFNDNREKTEA